MNFMHFQMLEITGDGEQQQVVERSIAIAKDKIEGLKEITRVDVVGALDREIQINVDMYKMEAANLTMRDVEMAVEAMIAANPQLSNPTRLYPGDKVNLPKAAGAPTPAQ